MKRRSTVTRCALLTVPALVLVFTGTVEATEPLEPPQPPAQRAEAKLARVQQTAETLSATARSSVHSARPVTPVVKTVSVDCDAGDSINAMLNRGPVRRAGQVIVQVSGTCEEVVEIRRPGVTLSGAVSGTAVIDPPDDGAGIPVGPAVLAVGAHELKLVNITLTGGRNGLAAFGSREMELDFVDAVGNLEPLNDWPCGVYLSGSEAFIDASNLSDNNCPLWADEHSDVIVAGSLMQNNLNDGPFSSSGSTLGIWNSTMLNNGFGPQAGRQSTTIVTDSIVESPGYAGWTVACSRATWISSLRRSTAGSGWGTRLTPGCWACSTEPAPKTTSSASGAVPT